MTARLTQAASGDSQSFAGIGDNVLIFSGKFTGGAHVRVTIVADSLTPSLVGDYYADDTVFFVAGSDATINVEVLGGNGNEAIDVSHISSAVA